MATPEAETVFVATPHSRLDSDESLTAAGAAGGPGRLQTLAALSAIVALGAALRVYRLGDRPFWFDEAFFWRLSQFPLREVVERTAADNYPALYPLLLKAWSMAFGCCALALRSMSALFGAATIAGAYLFCAEALHESHARRGDHSARHRGGPGLIAAALVAVSVFQIRWSWDVKMYTLGAMLSVYSSWALLRALRRKATLDLLLYAALALAFMHTHYYALFSVFPQAIFAAFVLSRDSAWNPRRALRDGVCRRWVLSLGVIAGGFAPWLPTFIHQHNRDRAVGLRPPVTIEKVVEAPFTMFCEPEGTRATVGAVAAVLLLSEIALLALLWRPSIGTCYTFFAATAPLALAVAVSLADTNVFEVRYLVFAQPFWLIAAAIAISQVPRAVFRRTLAGLLVASLLFAHARFWRGREFGVRPGARGVAEFLEANRRGGEPVLFCSQLYYYPVVYHSPDTSGLLLFDDEDKVHRHCWGSAILQSQQLIGRSACEALESPRIWVVDMVDGWGSLRVPPCSGWKCGTRQRFKGAWEFEGDYLVVEYFNTRSQAGTPD